MTQLETISPREARVRPPAHCRLPTSRVRIQLRTNPYSPGAGSRPASLAELDRELHDWSVALPRLEKARCAKSVVWQGLRGKGRTALPGELHRLAEEHDRITVMLEVKTASPMSTTLACALYPAVRELVLPSAGDKLTKALGTFKAFSVKVDLAGSWSCGLEVAFEGWRCDSGELETDLSELIRDL